MTLNDDIVAIVGVIAIIGLGERECQCDREDKSWKYQWLISIALEHFLIFDILTEEVFREMHG